MDVARIVRVGLDFLPQLVDEHTQVFRLFSVVRPPDSLQQAAVGLRLSLIGDQVAQQLKLLWREPDELSFD